MEPHQSVGKQIVIHYVKKGHISTNLTVFLIIFSFFWMLAKASVSFSFLSKVNS